MFRPEILAPAGNLFKLKTAVRYGADAVYIAGQKFGLRSAADNFTNAEIEDGCRFAARFGAKVYVVLNGFLFDDELAQLPPFLNVLEKAGVDAVIVSDLGVLEVVRASSRLDIHLSTQASALNSCAAKFWKGRGVKRMVLGREVSIREAEAIKRDARVEVELFAHGAMCMAYSGNCTISNYTAGRDSNRGGCVQSCRFKYSMSDERGGTGDSNYFLSSKDLQGIEFLADFCQSGIDSLKIEGRMKSALYVATTVSAYVSARDQLLNDPRKYDKTAFLAQLHTMSHRDYTAGNLIEKAGANSIYYHDDEHVPHSHDMLGIILEAKPNAYLALQLKNRLLRGEPAELITEKGGIISLDTSTLRSVAGLELEKAQPNRVVLLPYHEQAQKDLLVRKPKYAAILNNATRAV